MLSTDREEFTKLMRVLCNARDVPWTEPRDEAFWKSLENLTLIQIGRAVDILCKDQNPPKGLQPSHVWTAHKSARAPLTLTPPLTALSDTANYTVGQRYANILLMDWFFWHIRGGGEFITEAIARQMYAIARSLADQMHMLHADNDPDATTDRFHEEFCRSTLTLVNETTANRYRAHLAALPRVKAAALLKRAAA